MNDCATAKGKRAAAAAAAVAAGAVRMRHVSSHCSRCCCLCVSVRVLAWGSAWLREGDHRVTARVSARHGRSDERVQDRDTHAACLPRVLSLSFAQSNTQVQRMMLLLILKPR